MRYELIEKLIQFRKDRQWEKYHTPAELSRAISIEAAELQKEFLWKNGDFDIQAVKAEMADVYIFLLYLSFAIPCNLDDEALKKIEINAKKYPVKDSIDKW